MQMALVLVCGSALAAAPVVKKGISRLASAPKTPAGAIAFVSAISSVACWLNWGFGLIVGALIAKEVARKLRGVDYRLLIASAYSGFVVWHAGISGSVPLSMATAGDALTKATNGIVTEPVALENTIFNIYSLGIALGVIVALVIVNALMHPKGGDVFCVDPSLLEECCTECNKIAQTPAQKLESSRVLTWIISVLGLSALAIKLFVRGGGLDLNSVIMLFLFIGLLAHKTPIGYVNAFTCAASGAAGILLQFPFYAGIMGIITGTGASGMSLAGEISDAFISISNKTTFPLLTFLSAAIVNVFVPSGGGQWAVQAPIMFPAGAQLGVDPAVTGMAIAWGDAWTNLIQPFWAIPALAIAKLNAKDIMGFCLIDLLVTGVVICLGFLLWV
jgi:short-chain fatty acids transporter